jgi:hypothetical protein
MAASTVKYYLLSFHGDVSIGGHNVRYGRLQRVAIAVF